MQRRDIFTIFLKGSLSNQANDAEREPVIDTPDYLISEATVSFFREWRSPSKVFIPSQLTKHEFIIKLGANASIMAEVLTGISLRLGIKDAVSRLNMPDEITLGINSTGYLFIGDKQAKNKVHYEKLNAELRLILEVKPRPNGGSYIKLRVIDQIGLTLATLKSEQFLQENWAGTFNLEKGKFHYLQIEGRLASEEQQLLTTNISEY